MNFIQKSIEIKWPALLVEVVFLIGGILLLAAGIKVRKENKVSAAMSIVIGALIICISLYLLFWTFIVGYNA